MNQNWNAEKYSSGFSFVYKYGNDVLNLIETEGVHDVIDLGCGTGILTKALADKGFNVKGLDSSEDMLKTARANFPEIEFSQADATNFSVNEKVDLVFSNAVLHWIDKSKQLSMMKGVYEALRPGGQFVFEMGGRGNNVLIHSTLAEIFDRYGYKYVMPFYFPTIGEYAVMLEEAGFFVRYAILFDRPTPLEGDDGLYNWLKMFVNNPFKNVSSDDREKILREAVELLREKLFYDGIWHSDYVRLRMRAIKSISRL